MVHHTVNAIPIGTKEDMKKVYSYDPLVMVKPHLYKHTLVSSTMNSFSNEDTYTSTTRYSLVKCIISICTMQSIHIVDAYITTN